MPRYDPVVSFFLFVAFGGACGDQAETSVGSAGTTSTPSGAGGPSASEPPPCVENPTTHLELINACTTSVGVAKTPQLSLLNPDGSLPSP